MFLTSHKEINCKIGFLLRLITIFFHGICEIENVIFFTGPRPDIHYKLLIFKVFVIIVVIFCYLALTFKCTYQVQGQFYDSTFSM